MIWTDEEKEVLISAYENKIPIRTIELFDNKDNAEIARMAKSLELDKKYPGFDYMVGQEFGRLTVLKRISEKGKKIKYECQCSCNNINRVIVTGANLKSGHTQSCGCLRREMAVETHRGKGEDLTGKKFGKLTVLYRGEDVIYPSGVKAIKWVCQCECGKITSVHGVCLRNGWTSSCGCMQKYYNSLDKKKYNEYDLSGEYGIGYDKNGKIFCFDLEDYSKIKRFYWVVGEDGYVVSTDNENNYSKVRMHRVIMGLYPGNSEILVDHIHGESKYDNRKCNLRIATGSENCMNRALMCTNTSGVTGVQFDERNGCWYAVITKDYKQIRLGYYNSFEDAVNARKIAEDIYFRDRSYANSQAVDIGEIKQVK